MRLLEYHNVIVDEDVLREYYDAGYPPDRVSKEIRDAV
jgi:hypothetical protein